MSEVYPPSKVMSTSLHVTDLEPNVSEAQLYELFSQVGPVVSIRVCRDLATRRSLGHGYVNFNCVEDACRALGSLNFTNLNGKPMRIMLACLDSNVERRRWEPSNVFVNNLDECIDDKALFDLFSTFGLILSCKVKRDDSGQSKGYGFVQFEQEESAQSAIEKVNGMLLNDKHIFVGPFIRRQARDQSGSNLINLYVKNISESTTDEELRTCFGAFGPISSAVVMKDSEGRSKGFGFVNFEHADDAARAMETLNGKERDDPAVADMNGMTIVGKRFYVGLAQSKEERNARLQVEDGQIGIPVSKDPEVKTCVAMNHPAVPGTGEQNLYRSEGGQNRQFGKEQGAPHVQHAGARSTPRAAAGARSTPRAAVSTQGFMVGMLLVPFLELKATPTSETNVPPPAPVSALASTVASTAVPQPVPIREVAPWLASNSDLSNPVPIRELESALASASPEEKRTMLVDQLYYLVDKLEHVFASDVTGMLFHMGQTEILRLIESPKALMAKVAEVLEVLHKTPTGTGSSI